MTKRMAKRSKLAGGLIASLGTVLATAQFVVLAPAAHAVETQLSRTGWVASTNTSPGTGDAPANAIDGNISTRFSTGAAQASGQYFQVNMGSSQTFNQIVMNSGGSAGDYARGFNVEVSANGSTFTSVATGSGTSSPETVTFSAQTAQYIRVVLTAGVTTNWWSIAEFNAFNGTAETALSRTGWVASTNTSPGAGDAPANAIDGNTSTRFSTDADQASGMYFQVNMGSAQTFNQIVMDSGGSTGDYARGFNVEVSTNGTTFTSVATGAGTSSPETVTFSPQTAQYIRVVLTTGVTTNWWSIAEFNAFSGTAETVLTRTGWVASTNTSPGAGDAPANAIDGNTSTRFSTDADQASGMFFQVNMGCSEKFNQVVMDSGGSTGDYARGFNVEVSTNGTTFTSVATGTGTSSPETVTFSPQTAQYIRVVLTTGVTTNWWSIAEFNAFSDTGSSGGCGGGGGPPTGGSLGPNVIIFTPNMSQSSIQSQLNTISSQQTGNQFGTQRDAIFFEPGTYGSASSPLVFTVGYYTSVAGLGQ